MRYGHLNWLKIFFRTRHYESGYAFHFTVCTWYKVTNERCQFDILACSRRRAEIEAAGRLSTLHCTHTGDYEHLQCDDGLCWCAEPKTGQPTVTPVIEVDMEHLPCCKLFHEF